GIFLCRNTADFPAHWRRSTAIRPNRAGRWTRRGAVGGGSGERPRAAARRRAAPGKPKRKRAKVLVAASLAVALAAGAGGAYRWWYGRAADPNDPTGSGTALTLNADYLETLPYDFAEPRTVKADSEVVISFNRDVDLVELVTSGTDSAETDSEDEPLHHMLDFTRIADVFSDPGLTQRISAVVTVGRSETDIVIRPLVFGGDFDQVSMIEEVWWETDVLFVAQYWGADGGELARSLVTPVIVESDKGTRLAPVQGFAYSLAADGTVDFSWEPVEGADSYIVVLQRERRWSVVTEDGAEAEMVERQWEERRPQVDLLIKTDRTQANSSADALDGLSGMYDTLDGVTYFQNRAFDAAPVDQDQIAENRAEAAATDGLSSGYLGDFDINKTDLMSVAVLALNLESEQFGTAAWQDLTPALARIPTGTALQAAFELRDACDPFESALDAWAECLSRIPVTMADGHTAMAKARFDLDGAEYDGSSLAIYASMEEGGLIGVEIRHYHVGADWRAQVEAGLEAAAHSGQGAGLEDFAGYTEHDLEAMVQELEEAELSDTMPEVPYPVSGSSEYVQFVAANLIAGNRYLDITRFEDGGIGTPSFEDVLGEAVYQNPYILDHAPRSRTWDRDGKVLAYVSFARTDFDAAEAAPMQERVLAAANRAVAQVISNGMSDRDKALALNKWLIDQAAYDYDALEAINAATTAEEKASIFDSFPNNQNAYGVLVEGKGVCASYAQAYKALADAAGLRAVVVAGVVLESGERHAWNRVFMDGKWQNVDVTWNDGGDPTEYFGVTDASLERAPDWSWMTDTVLRSYAAD
ncbi:MAG: hypothetical protein LBD77_03330, partial [Bifidobacteriaceae bacterium]|nr:hypothetical protein [Bifidobacteriaceae bacterium]